MNLLPHPPGANQSLLRFSQPADVSFTDSQIQNITASTLSSIIQLNGLRSLLFDGLVISDIHTGCPVLGIANITCSPEHDCVIIHNMTFSDGSANALFVSNSAISVTDSMIANLRHMDSAIDIQNRDGSTASITNCTFSNLTVTGQGHSGGALFMMSPRVAITDCVFSSCTAAAGNAGAVFLRSTASLDGIWPNYSETNITSCNFENNVAAASGGAITFYGSAGSSYDYFRLRSSTVRNSTAVGRGAVDLQGLYYVGIEACLFEQNYCESGKGCALSFIGSVSAYGNVLLHNSHFMGNTVFSNARLFDETAADLSGYEQCAGAYFELGRCMGVFDCVFANNQGAGLSVIRYSGICEADYSSDNIFYQTRESSTVYKQLFNRSAVTDSYGSRFLTSFLGDSSISLDIRRSIFANNDAIDTQWSRGVKMQETGQWWVGTITGGGGMYIEGVQGGVLADLTIANNTANTGGGVYLNSCAGIVFWNSTFGNNSALSFGGGIFFSDNQGTGLMLGSSTMSSNQVSGHGGAIACNSPSSLIITNGSVLEGNSAADGGAIYCSSCKEVTIQLDSRLEGNFAKLSGGAGAFDDCGLVQIGHSKVIENRYLPAACCLTSPRSAIDDMDYM